MISRGCCSKVSGTEPHQITWFYTDASLGKPHSSRRLRGSASKSRNPRDCHIRFGTAQRNRSASGQRGEFYCPTLDPCRIRSASGQRGEFYCPTLDPCRIRRSGRAFTVKVELHPLGVLLPRRDKSHISGDFLSWDTVALNYLSKCIDLLRHSQQT